MKSRVLILVLWCAVALYGFAANPGYYRFPALANDTLVFTAEGDLWKVPISGGAAQRLTTHAGEETRAAISPDGRLVAFSATYEGPTEVYVMPIAGGLPRRLTWEGEQALVVGWTPEGKVMYATRHYSGLPDAQLAVIDPANGTRTLLPLAQASDGCFDPTGKTIFFTRLPFQGSHTKRYKGGTAQNLWKFAVGEKEAAPLTADFPGTSKTPMFWQGRIYFASDRDGTMNLWSMDAKGGDLKQHTHHQGWEIASPSLAAGRVAYQLGADIHVFAIASGKDSIVPIALASDFESMRERWVDKPMDYLTAAHLSADGDRVVLTARGQVFVVPVKQGRMVEASRAQGVRYRSARFLPGSKDLVSLSDQSGEVEWWKLPANGVGAAEQLTTGASVLRFDGIPSPDGSMIAFYDKDQALWLHHLRDKKTSKIASSPRSEIEEIAWSPDSGWIAFVVPANNALAQIKLYKVADGTTLDLTDDRTDSYAPTWTPDGKWIYFLSDRNLESAVGSPWGRRQPEPFIDRPSRIYAIALVPGVRFPFADNDELNKDADKSKKEEKSVETAAGQTSAKSGETKEAETKPKVTVTIEKQGLQQRLYQVDVPAGNYGDLSTNGERLFYLSTSLGQPRKTELISLEIGNKEIKAKTLLDDVNDYELSIDGKKILIRKGDTLAVFEAASKEKVDLSEKKIDLAGWKILLDPREEWRQMLTEAWRLERDYFYDRGMHGVDWKGMLDKYRPLLPRVTDRAELSDVFAMMISELSALHMFVRGGDLRQGKDNVLPACLGASLLRDDKAGGWRIDHVFRSDPNYPEELSPLAKPGVDVKEGEVITAINGVDPLTVADPAMLLRDKANKQVLIRVVSAENKAGRDVIVEPMTPSQESDLRYSEWEYTRRLKVEEMAGGDIGYLHLRAMTGGNYTEWARNFYPVFNRAGLIIDVRHNRGGNIDSWILEKLMRKAWFFWQPRIGETYWNMQYAFRGHLVVLTDQRTASDGEAFAEGVRRLGLGKILGMRTWGGEVWLSQNNLLVDRGIASAAETGVYGPEGEWLIEGWGVEPDMVVDNPPGGAFAGDDAQLAAAVKYLQGEIKNKPIAKPSPPRYPDKSFAPARK